MLPQKYKFSCSALPAINGYTLKANSPDENGCYEVIVGCIGIPTRNNVIYDPDSVIAAMSDPESRFNICLRDGNLAGEWGHPRVETKEDLNRLLYIDEKQISHYFRSIWIDEKPITIKGQEAFPIRAKVKPAGPYGKYLEDSLRDPCINTAFSIRSLCAPVSGPDQRYSYRKVEYLVTFDAVFAPGYEITSKRYAIGNESLDINTDDLARAILQNSEAGLEALNMLTDADVRRLSHKKSLMLDGELVGTGTVGSSSIISPSGEFTNAASLVYAKRNGL